MKASHPGDTLRWLMLEDGLLADDVAERTGLTPGQIRTIIEGTLPITSDIAASLEKLGGITASTWLKMQANFDEI